jgi:hypothetical protein
VRQLVSVHLLLLLLLLLLLSGYLMKHAQQSM